MPQENQSSIQPRARYPKAKYPPKRKEFPLLDKYKAFVAFVFILSIAILVYLSF
jgi:hypothetical protein